MGASVSFPIAGHLEVNVSGDGDDEGAGAARLVGGGHNDVAVRVATESDDLGDLIPRNELDGILVD
jgi:hypothetical protein